MSLLEELHKPDILDCISNLSSDEVFTPPKLVNEVLEVLPQELFSNPNVKFLDPCCKTGIFLREIAKRLLVGLEDKIPDKTKRIKHILEKQLFGIAITDLTSQVSRRTVYCSKDARNDKYKHFGFDTREGNIYFNEKINHIWGPKNNSTGDCSCMICGASAKQWNRGEGIEKHAYNFIHCNEMKNKDLFKRLKDMKFDVIIGNPPYQLKDGGNSASAGPLYHLFVKQAKKLNPRYVTMIVPSRWFSGGKGLDSFRDEMLHDSRIRVIHDFLDAGECFPGVEIKGGVCYFLWDRDNKGLCEINTHQGGIIISSLERPLLEPNCETFIRYNEAISILKKVQEKKEKTLDTQASSRKPFGLATNFEDYCEESSNCIKVYANKKTGFLPANYKFEKGNNLIKKWKVLAPKAIGSGNSQEDWLKPLLSEPNSVCTETYIVLGSFDNKEEADNFISYTQTKFFHFLLTLKKVTQDATAKVYQFVPIQNYREDWSDEKLYKKYELTEIEIKYIESMVRNIEQKGE